LIKAAVFGGFYFLAGAIVGPWRRFGDTGARTKPESLLAVPIDGRVDNVEQLFRYARYTAGREAPLQGHRFFIRGGIQLLFTQSSEFCSKMDFMENTGGFFGKKPRIFHYFSWNSGCKNVSFFVE
jgi:hypothetical protein